MKRISPMILCAALTLSLCACGGPAAETDPPSQAPSPSPSETVSPAPAGPSVSVDWDVLEGREPVASTAKRRTAEWMDDFVPGSYGEILPYIGAEQTAAFDDGDEEVRYEKQFLCGLCTPDGTLLTDPVFTAAYRLSWWDQALDKSVYAPAWIVQRTLRDPAQADNEWNHCYYTAVGVIAADGSWYTGCRFRSEVSSTIAISPYSVLMMEDADNAVLLSLKDGSELKRYSPYDFLGPDDPEGRASWFFSDGLSWGMIRCYGDYLYCDMPNGGFDEGVKPIWIDAKTGEFLDEPPMELPEYQWTGKIRFDDGWYQDVPANGEPGDLVIHYDDGSEETIHLDGSLGSLSTVTRDRLIFYHFNDAGSSMNYTLTDHNLNVLFDGEETSLWVLTDEVTGRQWFTAQILLDQAANLWHYTVLDKDGKPLISSHAYLNSVSNGLISVVEDAAYRMVDLNNGGREIFRLPRFATMG